FGVLAVVAGGAADQDVPGVAPREAVPAQPADQQAAADFARPRVGVPQGVTAGAAHEDVAAAAHQRVIAGAAPGVQHVGHAVGGAAVDGRRGGGRESDAVDRHRGPAEVHGHRVSAGERRVIQPVVAAAAVDVDLVAGGGELEDIRGGAAQELADAGPGQA